MAKENESITFRIGLKAIKRLQEQAENDEISLNTLVNRVLTGYLEWDIHSAARKFGIIEKSILKYMVQEISDEKLKEIVATQTRISDLMLLTRDSKELDAIVHAIKIMAQHSGYSIRTFETNEKRRIVIQHDLGAKWSGFYKAQIDEIIKQAGGSIVVENTDNSLIITVNRF